MPFRMTAYTLATGIAYFLLLASLFSFFAGSQFYLLLPLNDYQGERILYILLFGPVAFFIYRKLCPPVQSGQVFADGTVFSPGKHPQFLPFSNRVSEADSSEIDQQSEKFKTGLDQKKLLKGSSLALVFAIILWLVALFYGRFLEISCILNQKPEVLFFTGFMTPLVEEFFFRYILLGFFLSYLPEKRRLFWAIILQAALFTLVHDQDYFIAPVIAAVGLVCGWLAVRYGVYASMLLHICYNILLLNLCF